MGQVNDHSREETCFRHSQKKAGRIKLSAAVHEARKYCDHSPGNHDPCGPFSRAPALYDNGARHFEEDIPDEEHRPSTAVDSIAEPEIKIHFQGSERYVG